MPVPASSRSLASARAHLLSSPFCPCTVFFPWRQVSPTDGPPALSAPPVFFAVTSLRRITPEGLLAPRSNPDSRTSFPSELAARNPTLSPGPESGSLSPRRSSRNTRHYQQPTAPKCALPLYPGHKNSPTNVVSPANGKSPNTGHLDYLHICPASKHPSPLVQPKLAAESSLAHIHSLHSRFGQLERSRTDSRDNRQTSETPVYHLGLYLLVLAEEQTTKETSSSISAATSDGYSSIPISSRQSSILP